MTDALRKKLARIAAKCCDPSTTDALDKVIAGLDRAALAAPAVPAGWVLVPVEPTAKMLDAFNNYALCTGYVPEGYRAMLAAAPDAQKGEP